jgi:hypothetical protein
MYVVSFLTGAILLVVMKRWKTLGAGVLSLFAVVVILPRFIGRACGCSPQESSAVSNLRTINTAQVTYLSGHNNYGSIEDLIKAGLLDRRYREGLSGYRYSIQVSGENYSATAKPVSRDAREYGYYSKCGRCCV